MLLCGAMDWDDPYQFHPILSMLRISPDAVVIIFGIAMTSQNIHRIMCTVVGMLGREEIIQKLHALIDAVIIELRGWTGESGEAHRIKVYAGMSI